MDRACRVRRACGLHRRGMLPPHAGVAVGLKYPGGQPLPMCTPEGSLSRLKATPRSTHEGHTLPVKGTMSARADWAATVRSVVPIGAAV